MKLKSISILAMFLSSIAFASDSDKMVKQHTYDAQSKVEKNKSTQKKSTSPYNKVKMHPKKKGVKMHPKKGGVKMHKAHGSSGSVPES